jgi:hypothetical protein
MGRTAADWHHRLGAHGAAGGGSHNAREHCSHWCLGLGIRTPNSQMCNKNNKEKKGARELRGPTDFCFSARRTAKIAITQNKCAT